jgi:uncharacterized Zn finger protein
LFPAPAAVFSPRGIGENGLMPEDLLRALNDDVLRRLAGDQSYGRGVDYHLHGRVELLGGNNGSLLAAVRGSRDYTVRLAAEAGALDFSCDCPIGEQGGFCKHCVAAALAWLSQSGTAETDDRPKAAETTLAGARRLLLSQDKETLVETILEWAKTDNQLRERLILHAARHTGPESAVLAVHKALTKAVQARGFIRAREMASYARAVNRAIDAIEQLLRDGQAPGVARLCEAAAALIMHRSASVDDTAGHMNMLLERVQELHYRACLQYRPDPEALARVLFEWERQGGHRSSFLPRYAQILGPRGMEAFHRLAAQNRTRGAARF